MVSNYWTRVNIKMDEMTKILSKAKIGIMIKHNSRFLQQIMYSIKFEYSKELPTAATDGLNILINPDWFKNLHSDERIGLIAHELWHIAFEHMVRVGNKDPIIYNQAADHVINLILLDHKYTLPPDGLHDPKFKNMSTEQVYDHLIKNKQDQNKDVMLDLMASNKNQTKEQKEKLQEKITNILVKAKIACDLDPNTKAGSIPNEIKIKLNKILYPKLPWNVILQNYLTEKIKEEYTFQRPNKRYLPDWYLPTLSGEGLGSVVICIDSSASVLNEDFQQYLAEIKNIKSILKPSKLHIINFDTKVKEEYCFTKDEPIENLSFTGRGGTCLFPANNRAKELKPDIIIFFSDLYCEPIRQDEKPDCDTIWIAVGNKNAKTEYGKIIYVD